MDVLDIIDVEDKKNPFTDEEIAEKLNILREVVTEKRKELGIPDSRERRKKVMLKDAIEILKRDNNISDRAFTKVLNDMGYNVARFAASNIKREAFQAISSDLSMQHIDGDKNEEGSIVKSKSEKNIDVFQDVVGYEGSLKLQINQAKAAISYPPKGLHTLLLGPSGVGKSYLAEKMYEFAKSTENFSEEAPFMVFNCADYVDNPQLLLSQLFGYSKGAFTGASENKKGIVEICNGGILFLDEIHRLPAEGQEILFYLLDRGKFRRLGETEVTRESNLMIIAATTENPESFLLLTFRRRIPMIIEIPSVSQRPYDERFQIIKNFFFDESVRIGKDIFVRRDVIKAFMTYDCPGNIGQLKSDIQVCCARGFLNSTLNNRDKVKVNFQHIPDHVKDQLISSNKNHKELEKYTKEDIIVSAKGVEVLHRDEYNSVSKANIYQFIEDRYKELKVDGYSDKDINKIVGQQVEGELMRFASYINLSSANVQEIINIIGQDMVNITQDVYELAKKYISCLQRNVIYPLAIHLSSTYERVLERREIVNPNLEMIKEKYSTEFTISEKIAKLINNRLKIKLPEDEVGFIALYLKNFQRESGSEEGRVGVIVLSHGRVASGMAEVANRLLGVNHAIGLDMDLSDSPNIMLEKTIKLVKQVNQGKGCILLVDMGSLTTFGDIVTAKTGIPTRAIGRVDTLMVLECVRRALLPEDTLDSIADEVDSKGYYYGISKMESNDMSKVIITLCITGEGSAMKVKQYIENSLGERIKEVEIIPLGYMNNEDITVTLDIITRSKQVLAIVGTINPEFKDIPFISVEDLITGKSLITLRKIINNEKIFKNNLSKVIPKELIFHEEDYKYKDEVIDMMSDSLLQPGLVEEGFLLSVYRREALGGTYLKGGIAIPHGDSKYVTKPTIAVTRLANPINWDGTNNVDLIFLIALEENSKEYLEQLYKIISSRDALQSLRDAKDKEEFMKILFKSTITAK
ncbi:sigma 54-interacting transcriptional regulator [Desnuesiella massiliensis]|uniref:sigma 54-interacting transcriptional regulator n=1 Tax=Desnuesiella massiliensis TaxID=1650662 RepID=UPI0006E38BAA|nr:sigma 54-interacting transcriptional regulator [Desnuesiella massiliensis]